MIRVGIIGATGYTGAELIRLLTAHPGAKVAVITSRQYAGTPFSDIYPAFRGVTDLVCETWDPATTPDKADFFFTALPHKLPMSIVPDLLAKGKRVVDLSADFRFRNAAAYEAAYQPHSAKDLLAEAVYGLCEVYRPDIREARIVGNPGCYPTTVLLPLVPLVKAGLLSADGIICDAKSGVSGAGRGLALSSHFCEVNDSFKAYKVAAHRHNPEMNEVLTHAAGRPARVTFVPHLVPMTRGMLTTIYASPLGGAGLADIRRCLEDAYGDSPFVRLLPEGKVPDTLYVRGTNFCDIGWTLDEAGGRIILISAIDNLVKGASGQAVQNMNLMMGQPETAGLNAAPSAL